MMALWHLRDQWQSQMQLPHLNEAADQTHAIEGDGGNSGISKKRAFHALGATRLCRHSTSEVTQDGGWPTPFRWRQ